MPRASIYSHWSIDLEGDFSRRDTDDGYVVFEMPGRSAWAVVYEVDDTSPDDVLSKYLSGRQATDSQFPFRSDTHLRGNARLTREADGWQLDALAATRGQLACLAFCFKSEADLTWALSAWRTTDHSPPSWVQMCMYSEPPMMSLRRALEHGVGIDDALEELDLGQLPDTAAPMLIEALRDESATVRQSACYALGQMRNVPAAITALSDALQDESGVVRVHAADALVQLGEPIDRVVPTLIEVLERPDASPLPKGEERIEGICRYLTVPDRYHAAMALADLGPAGAAAKSSLQRTLWDESGCVRVMSAKALFSQGESTAAVIPSLLSGLADPDMSQRERVWLAEALFGLGEPVEVVLPALIELVRGAEWPARAEALELLKQMGPCASGAMDAVAEAMNDESPGVRALATETLPCITPAE